jgi:hypothetical protein
VSILLRSSGSVLRALGTALLTIAVISAVGFLLNWAVLWLNPSRWGWPILGVLFPLAWMVAAKPIAVSFSLRRMFRLHREQLVAAIAHQIETGMDGKLELDGDQWSLTLQTLRQGLESQQPRVMQPVIRAALSQAGVTEMETAFRRGTGPAPARIAGIVADRLDQQLAGRGTLPLRIVLLANAVAIVGVMFLR